MYAVAADQNVMGAAPAMPAVGSDFWNLGYGKALCDLWWSEVKCREHGGRR
jgi:hypothetical protein